MPTILRVDGYRVVIYLNDHQPEHVHVIGNGHEAVFGLNCPIGPVWLRENYGFSLHEVRLFQKRLAEHLAKLCRAWEEIHGYS